MAVEALLDGQAETLTKKAIEKALEGDMAALRLCLDRICPPRKDAPVALKMPPMNGAGDAATAMAFVLTTVASGELTPTEGAAIAGLVETYRRTLGTTDTEQRIAALEKEQPR